MTYMVIIKVIGMILTLGASTALGLYLASLGTFRQQDLLELKKALLILKSEIEYVATPLPEAMVNIAARTIQPISRLFAYFAQNLKQNEDGETVYRLWLSAIDIHKREVFLKEEDWEVIGNFGKTLGYLDKQMQVDSINFTIDYIDTQASGLQENNEKNRRMYQSLGIIGGILLLVVFW